MKLHDFNGHQLVLNEYQEHEYQALLTETDHQADSDTQGLMPECFIYE